jgi:hypothetical protein
MKCIKFGAGYHYQLRTLYRTRIEILPDAPIVTPWIWLSTDGDLTICPGYAWDGATWCPDVGSIMRASLCHDALYQLMRLGRLDRDYHRYYADRMFRRMCLEDGMPKPLAWAVYQAVRLFANPAADPARREPDRMAGQCAPDGL